MPERYSITTELNTLGKRYNAEVPGNYQPRYNAAPGQLLPVLTSEHAEGFSYFYWGTIPDWSKNRTISRKLLMIPLSEILSKPIRIKDLMIRRCIIPADGYYEWKQVGKKTRIPYRFVMNDNQIFSFAGIWEEFDDENDKTHHIFRVITVPAPDVSQNFNDEVPLILKRDNEEKWMKENSEENLKQVLNNYDKTTLRKYTVNPGIEDIEKDHEGLILPYDAMDQYGNYSLFN